ncbi:MAG: Na/Pi cotransporter family protein [Bacillota bacterium]
MGRTMLFGFMGGLGLFVYGMRAMGDGLQKAAGERMRRLLEGLTRNPLMGVVVGIVVTTVIQSSSATTVMVVGFVNAGLMTLPQAVGVIMGANIGTTVTAQLIAFKITDYALPAIGVGAAFFMFGPRRVQRDWGQIIFGFGCLFLGMQTMGKAVEPLKHVPRFINLTTAYSHHPVLGVITGTLMTAVIQSSSATIGILQAMAREGLVTLRVALPILFGDNIGTCVTALISSIGTSVTARRAAMLHLMINAIGATVFIILLPVVTTVVTRTSPDVVRQIANAHTLFNVTNTLLLLPVAGYLLWLVQRLVPGSPAPQLERGPKYLDRRLLNTPSVAMGQVAKELVRMGELAGQMLADAFDGFLSGDLRKAKAALEKEEVVNELEREITVYMVTIYQRVLTRSQSERLNVLFNIVNDIERVGDHAENIAELAEYKKEQGLPFSPQALDGLNTMYQTVSEAFAKALSALNDDDLELANEVIEQERLIDRMEKELRQAHISRLNQGRCYPGSGVVFLDVISNLERIGDHSCSMANCLLGNFQ